MNHRSVFKMLGLTLRLEALLMLLPLVVSLIYGENCVSAFALTIAIAFGAGVLLKLISGKEENMVLAREGLVTVAVAWVFLSAVGALPFYFSGEIPSYTDAFFETVSGFTTTGASVITDVESLSYGILFWRSFTHWIGGMGVIVLVMAITPTSSGRSMHIMRAEMPGPIVGKLLPRVRDTAKILYLIYIVLTVAEILFLVAGDMNLYESIVYSFGTAGTGGFGIRGDSVGGYSAYSQWVITAFMLIFGVNFNIYFLILMGRVKNVLKSDELRAYILIVVAAIGVIAVNIYHLFGNLADTMRYASFQVASIITTTGYATADFNLWPGTSKIILLLLMFVGACAGSTAGGLKVSRIVIMFKTLGNNLRKMLRPRSVTTVRFEGKAVDEATRRGVGEYLMLYLFLYAAFMILISFEPFDFETNFSAIAACINNVGPGFSAVGPAASYASYSAFSKYILSFAMLLGRLELYPILLALMPSTWIKKN